jgi:hypothetical protein
MIFKEKQMLKNTLSSPMLTRDSRDRCHQKYKEIRSMPFMKKTSKEAAALRETDHNLLHLEAKAL